MPHSQSPPLPRDAGCRSPAARRVRVAASVCLAFAVCFICVAVEGTNWVQGGEVVVLRSFAPGASARLEIGAAGARSRLVAENLPRPDALRPDARAYVVWATGGAVRRLGVLRQSGGGSSAFEFRHPAGLTRYGVVVTAEINSDAALPAGAPVFASRALEVAAVVSRPASAPRPVPPTTSRGRVIAPRGPAPAAANNWAVALAAEAEERARICAGVGCSGDNFVGEVRSALGALRARTLLLVAARGAGRRTRGLARVAGGDEAVYARLRLRRVPPPSRFGARRHVLWAVTDAAGPVYIGTLPEAGLDRAQTFVRAAGVADPNFRLLVTAERTCPSARPAGRRVLLTFKGRRKRGRRR